MRYYCATVVACLLFGAIPILSYSQPNENTPAISEETANRAKDYFDVLSQITMSLNGTKCEQIQRDIRSVNTPQNRMKMDFDLSSIQGSISQTLANQYQTNIQAFREANNNYLAVCKSNPQAAQANADLHELFKSSVAKADAKYEKMKAESEKAMAEATKAKAEADKARAEADRAKAEADSKRAERAQIEIAQANEDKKRRADGLCRSSYFVSQWQESFKDRRILECLRISPETRLKCFSDCDANPGLYRWGTFGGSGYVSVCLNSPVYDTKAKQQDCLVTAARICFNGCLGLQK